MLRDVFYFGEKPNVHPRERPAKDIDDARQLATTYHFWIINKFCEYSGFDWDFDFEFLPDEDVWAEEHNNIWPSQHQKDSGTWLCPKEDSQIRVYRADVAPLNRQREPNSYWKFLDEVDKTKFDFSWHPDPTEPPYIYKWGSKFASADMRPALEYHTPGNVGHVKHMKTTVELLPLTNNWKTIEKIKENSFDFTWRPPVLDTEPFIYAWGSKWADVQQVSVLEYHAPGNDGTIKYMNGDVELEADMSKWEIVEEVELDSFDFTWRPDPLETEPFIYVFGNHLYEGAIMPTLKYTDEGATEIKYVDEFKPKLIQKPELFEHYEETVTSKFDYSWRPNPTAPAYIYAWGNQWNEAQDKVSVAYIVEDATEYQFMEERTTRKSCKDNWMIPNNVDVSNFDFSWEPNPNEPATIHEFATQWQKTGGPTYHVEGATEVKYEDIQAVKALPRESNWEIPDNVDRTGFDFSWHPDSTSPPYIYHFPTQWALSGGLVYKVDGATEVKYVEDQVAMSLPNKDNWEFDNTLVDEDDFDYSWHPYVEDEPFIYQFGTQHQKTGGHRYITPGVHGGSAVKYIDTRILKSKRLANPDAREWGILGNCEIEDFDWSWHHDETEEPFIYQFGNKFYSPEDMPTVEYRVEGAKEVKYTHHLKAELAQRKDDWIIPKDIDIEQFDFSWVPNPNEPPLIHEFGTQWQTTGGPRYIVGDATEVKHEERFNAVATPNMKHWEMPPHIDAESFDFSWHPDANSPPYIYVFSTQWALSGGPVYMCEGGKEIKYVEDIVAKALPNKENWEIPDDIDEDSFDWSWHPYAEDDPFIYQFGTQWQKTGGPRYIVDNATQIKYIDRRILKATKLPSPDSTFWSVLNDYEIKDFDYSWHHDDTEDAFIYQFGNKYCPAEAMPTIEYNVPGGEEVKYINTVVAELKPSKDNWEVPNDVDVTDFDFSWRPSPLEEPFIHQFGTQHQKTGGPRYIVNGASEVKYIETRILQSKRLPNRTHWKILDEIDVETFDFSWHPDELAPSVIYQFGTLEDNVDGPIYETPNNNGEIVYLERIEREIVKEDTVNYPRYYIETTLDDLVDLHKDEIFWALSKGLDYDEFDFSWKPSIEQVQYVHAWGSSSAITTQTYFINGKMWHQGNRDINWVEDLELDDKTLAKMFEKPDMFYVDRGNKESQERFELIKQHYPSIQKTRYLNSWVDTVSRCINRSTTELLWVLNSELDYADFDFEYYPNPWQMKMVTVFGTQWSHWGTTYLVNRETFGEDTKFIKVIEHLNNLNFVKHIRAKATECVYDVVVVDHGNKETEAVVNQLQDKAPRQKVTTIQHETDYFVTLKNIVAKLPTRKEHYVWIASSICDYGDFDLSYICDPFARDQLHVFPSSKQKFGDTFFIDVNKTRELIGDMTSLEDYEKINYNQTLRTQRLRAPVIVSKSDTHTKSVKDIDNFPYAVIVSETDEDIQVVDETPMSLWSAESKNIIVQSTGGTRIIVPREVKDHVKRELYEYPYIKNANRLALSKPMDIVFLSNGETGAEENWEHLQRITKNIPNRVVRVDGVDGRVQAYHASAEASETPWAFTVFAKLKVSPKFDFNWQPDRMQQPKHYIFEAKNPVNGLVYGHQAMIAYNKELTLANYGYGLDFTLDDEHASVPLLSGIAQYNTDEFSTWRTAFREVIKLLCDDTEISKTRLDAWLNEADPKQPFFQESIKGAIDGEEYFNEVDGDFEKLRLSYEWEWLKERYEEVSY